MKEIYVVNVHSEDEDQNIAAFDSYSPIEEAIKNWLAYMQDYSPLEWENEYYCHTDEREFFIDIVPLYLTEN